MEGAIIAEFSSLNALNQQACGLAPAAVGLGIILTSFFNVDTGGSWKEDANMCCPASSGKTAVTAARSQFVFCTCV